MTLPTNFPTTLSILDLNDRIKEFEYRKSEVLAFFERRCAKKTDVKRRDILICLDNADTDFNKGSFSGHDASMAFDTIKKSGFGNMWAESLKYAYWFSLPKERHAFKNHVSAGVVASHPELKQRKPITSYYNVPTQKLGQMLLKSQNDLLWPFMSINSLLFIAQEKLAPVDGVTLAVQKAQTDADNKGIKEGIQTMKVGLLPYFFQQEKEKIAESNLKGIPYETFDPLIQKRQETEPYLENFAYLFLTQTKFYQDLIIRNFSDNAPQKVKQELLPLTYGRVRE